MAARRLLICFDAFGTLFTPKVPVMQQYADVARSLGLQGFTNEQVGAAFAKAYKHESTVNPNYGHSVGLGAQSWWTNIIESTFRQVIPPSQKLPDELVPRLLHRFWSEEGYKLYADVPMLLHRIRKHAKMIDQDLVVGVITNSDDRVPDILRALGLRVATTRYGRPAEPSNEGEDIDFVVMSYDVGHEKPDRRIFDAAVQVWESIRPRRASDISTRVYIGDEYAKDVVGSLAAGWNAVLINGEGPKEHPDLAWPEDCGDTLFEGFQRSRALAFTSFKRLADSIPV